MPDDPYADPATGVLRNKLGLPSSAELEAAEREITHAALIFLRESPDPASYDLRHLCAAHHRIFGDIYDWAGQLRTVAIAKGTWFCLPQYIESSAAEIFRALHGEGLLAPRRRPQRRRVRRHHGRRLGSDAEDARRADPRVIGPSKVARIARPRGKAEHRPINQHAKLEPPLRVAAPR
jgi:fido (protein-threonine AMPylation protein)